MPEQITYTRLSAEFPLPVTINLNFTDVGLLEILKDETGKDYDQLLRTAIRELYYNRHTVFNKEK